MTALSKRSAKLYLTKYRSREEFEDMLRDVGLEDVQSMLWELDYDMVTARKAED